MAVHLNNDWQALLDPEFQKPYYLELRRFLVNEYRSQTVFPPMENIFDALRKTPYASVKVVLLGQDPYHEPGQAEGLSFSVPGGMPLPPSLQNIYKEINQDLGDTVFPLPNYNGHLEAWTRQGVLLLNSVLTVRAHEAASHRGKGWEILTDRVIELLNEREEPLVFLLWGGYARAKKKLITNTRHLVLEAAHPSPLSAYNGFFGCRHFSKANDFLIRHDQTPIDWRI